MSFRSKCEEFIELWLKNEPEPEDVLAMDLGDSGAYSAYTNDTEVIKLLKQTDTNIKKRIDEMNKRAQPSVGKKDKLDGYRKTNEATVEGSKISKKDKKLNIILENENADKEYDEPTK